MEQLYSFIKVREKYQEKNIKLTKYLLSGGENNACNIKTVFMQTVDRKLELSQCNQ